MKLDAPRSEVITDRVVFLRKTRLGLIFAAYVLVGANGGALGVILPALSVTYNLDKSATGSLFLAGSVGYLIAAFVSGWLVERLGIGNLLLAGFSVLGLSSLLLVLQPPFALVLVTRLLLGLAGALLETAGNFYVAALPRNTALLNYLHAFFGGGALIGPIVASSLLSLGGTWNLVYLIWLAASVLLGLAVWLVFRSLSVVPSPVSESNPTTQSAQTDAKVSNSMSVALRSSVIWLAAIFLLVYVGGESSVGSWGYTFLTEYGYQSAALAGWLVSGYWLGLTLGRLALARLVDWLGLSNRTLLLGCIVGSIVGACGLWLAPTQPVVTGLSLLVIGFAYGPIYPTTLAVLSQLIRPALLPVGIAFTTSLSILGVAIFPWLAGNLFQLGGLGTLFPYVIALSVLMMGLGVVLLRPNRNLPGKVTNLSDPV